MAGKPIAGPGSTRMSEEPATGASGAGTEGERDRLYGPLAVRRMNKEDGRALILYSRRTEDAER